MITFGSVNINEKTKELVMKALNEGKIGQSEYIEEFEKKFAEFLGVRYCVAVCNGTMADTIALAVLKYFNPKKKKVAVPALTFIAQINAIYYNHLEPIFYDNEPVFDDETLCHFPVHLLGIPAQLYDFPTIEDACEALGSKKNDKYCGTIKEMGTFSFFPSHTITTGEGGMIATNNEDYYLLAKKLRNHGKITDDSFHFDTIGFNGKMTTLQAMIGLSLIDSLPSLIEKRHSNYVYLGGKEGVGEYVVAHGFPLFSENRDEKRKELFKKGIDSRNLFSSIPTQEKAYEFLGYKKGDFPLSEIAGDTGLYVPCHQNLTDEELEYIKKNI